MRVKYNEERLREELRAALLVVPKTRGQLDGFGSSSSGSQMKGSNGPVVTTLPCRTFKQASVPLPPHAFLYAKLIREMNTNHEPIADWLRYCYSEGAQLPTATLLQALLDVFYEEETKALGAKSRALIKNLALLACQQKRDALNACTAQISQVRIAEYAGKKPSAWKESWSKRWNRLLNILSQFDKEGLDHVHESRRRKKAAARNGSVSVQCRVSSSRRDEVAA